MRMPSPSKLRHDYFRAINNVDQAYWLGMLAADGCVYENTVQLQLVDSEVVAAFAKAVGCDNKTDVRTRNGTKTSYRCKFSSPTMVAHLADHGIVARKSKVIRAPKLKDVPLQTAFWRGYFDGDGCFSRAPKSRMGTRATLVSGSRGMLLDFQRHFLRCGVRMTPIVKQNRADEYIVYQVAIGQDYLPLFIQTIYNDNGPRLARKEAIAKAALETARNCKHCGCDSSCGRPNPRLKHASAI